MKIIDTTTYFEEDLMMDLRFHILDPYVDKFVICEANFTHSGNKKEIKFDKNNYQKFKDKIVHLVIEKDPVDKFLSKQNDVEVLRSNSIKRIEFQRNQIINALKNDNDEDYVIYSDNDEIPNLKNINFKKNNSKIILFKQKLFYYKFNLLYFNVDWFGSKCCKKKDLQNISWLRSIKNKKYSKLRFDTFFSNRKYSSIKIIDDGGWHFSNLKTPKELLKKYLNDEMHAEFEVTNDNLLRIKDKIERRYINYDHFADQKVSIIQRNKNEFPLKKINLDILPDYIKDNLTKYEAWIDNK